MVTLSNTGGTVSIEKTGEVYDYSENTDGSFEYYSYMNRDFNVTATANTYAKGSSDYELQYNGKNVNGVDTTTTYKYIKNVDCTSKKTNSASAITLDHFNASKYRIYSLVVTYDNPNQEYVITAIKQPVVARSYIRYTDANGLLRTYYNDYSGTSTYKGCSTSYSKVKDFIQDNYQNIDK